MIKPVCVKCQRFFRPKKNGIRLLEGRPIDNAKPGVEEAHNWLPYKVWQADLWECNGCGATIVHGSGKLPIWEDYKGPLPELEYLKVNDC
jgi:hypothetical protein